MPIDLTIRGEYATARPVFSAQVEVRAVSDGTGGTAVKVSGYASTTEAPYEMYDEFGAYTEVVSRGSFGKTLAEKPKVQLLVNHGGMSLAATSAGTLRLSEDDTGLHMEADLNPARRDAADLIAALEDRAVDEMSFAFRVMRQAWSPDYSERRIDEVNLNRGDVSVVNLGANPDTSVALRSFRNARPAELHRIAQQLRAGATLSKPTMDVLSQVLDLLATADDAVDAAQPLLATLMGVPNPDADEMLSAPVPPALFAPRYLAERDIAVLSR